MDSPTPYQITLTGLIIHQPGETEPDTWTLETIVSQMVPDSVNIKAAPMIAKRTEKRAYRCSICGGRHASNHCPQAQDTTIQEGGAK